MTAPTLEGVFSVERLHRVWQELRWAVTRVERRDCLDHLEADLDSRRWLLRLRRQVVEGTYHPQPPQRQEAAKTAGAYRVITVPVLADVVVYRVIADFLYEQAKGREYEGAFFAKRVRSRRPLGDAMEVISEADYQTFFEIWIRYSQYRKRVLLSSLFKCIVVTDISNFFESIQHQLLLEHLAQYGLPREATGVLGQLLEALRPSVGHSPMPAVGICVDPYDCSRVLAHLFLFEHDRAVVDRVGEGAYVRWMDDQNIGVSSEVDARSLVRLLTTSLAKKRLVLNSGKTKFLDPAGVVSQFWLDENDALEKVEKAVKFGVAQPVTWKADFELRWGVFRSRARSGNWDKIAARLFALAAHVGSDSITKDDCLSILIDSPSRAARIFEYLIARGRWIDFVDLFLEWLESGNSLYEDVETAWFEAVLIVTPPRSARRRIRDIALEFARGSRRGTGRSGPRVPAILLLYWLGGRAVRRNLEWLLKNDAETDGDVRRCLVAVLTALAPDELDDWLALAAHVPSSAVSSLLQWLARMRQNERPVVPHEFVFRRRPWLTHQLGYDARSWLRLELLLTSQNPRHRVVVAQHFASMRRHQPTAAESVIARRVERRLGVVGIGRSTRRPTYTGRKARRGPSPWVT